LGPRERVPSTSSRKSRRGGRGRLRQNDPAILVIEVLDRQIEVEDQIPLDFGNRIPVFASAKGFPRNNQVLEPLVLLSLSGGDRGE